MPLYIPKYLAERVTEYMDGKRSSMKWDPRWAREVVEHLINCTTGDKIKWTIVRNLRKHAHLPYETFEESVFMMKMGTAFCTTDEPNMLIKSAPIMTLKKTIDSLRNHKFDIQRLYWYFTKVVQLGNNHTQITIDELTDSLENQGMLPRMIKKILKDGNYATKRGIGKKRKMHTNRLFADITIKFSQ